MSTCHIAEVAELIGVPATTLRYYEDAEVVARPSRGDNGYRVHDDRDVDRLRFVARARQLDLGIDDLRELVEGWEADDCSAVQHRMAEVVATRSTEAQQQIADLIELAAQLQATAVARTAIDGGVALQLPADPDTAAELGRLAAAEQECCSFFDFRLHLAGPVIEFEVRAPNIAVTSSQRCSAPAHDARCGGTRRHTPAMTILRSIAPVHARGGRRDRRRLVGLADPHHARPPQLKPCSAGCNGPPPNPPRLAVPH